MMHPASRLRPATAITRLGVLWFCLGSAAGALLLPLLPIKGPLWTAFRLAMGFFAVGIAPGLVLAMAFGGFKQSALRFLAQGAALSLGSAQLLCLVSLNLHVASQVTTVGWLLTIVSLAVVMLLGWRRDRAPTVFFPIRERWLVVVILLVAAALYPKGSVIFSTTYEDLWHLSVLNRLVGSAAPSITNTFVEPGLPFTHPLPGIGFFLAMVSHGSGEWPLVVYNKARCFWALVSLAFAYVTASYFFPRRLAPAFVVAALALLILNGSLADTGWPWGQAAPVSHNTDVVMGAVVPGIVAMMLAWLYGAGGRSRIVSLAALGGLIMTVVFSHVREAPQVLLYVVAWGVAFWWTRSFRAWQLLGVAAGLVVAIVVYGWWHSAHVPLIREFVGDRREGMLRMIESMERWDWWRAPRNVYPLEVLWEGWHPVLIVLCPLVVAIWGRLSAALAVAFTFLAALLLIRLPALSLAASFLTYDEILMFPVRFFTPFSVLVLGVLAWRLSMGAGGAKGLIAATAVGLLGAAVFRTANSFLVALPDLFFGAALITAAFAVFVAGRHCRAIPRPAVVRFWPPVLFLAGVSVASWCLRSTPLNWSVPALATDHLFNPNQAVWSGADILRTFRTFQPAGPGAAPSHPPPLDLVNWLNNDLPPDSVLITNPDNHYVLTAFAPPYQVGWCYLRWLLDTPFSRTFDQDGAWPFFGHTWSDQRRWEFCRQQGITNVVIDPALATRIKGAFAASPSLFEEIYSAEGWRVLRVIETEARRTPIWVP